MTFGASKDRRIRRCPLPLVLPPPRQTNSGAGEDEEKQELIFSEHQRSSALTLLSTASKTSLVPLLGSPLGHERGMMEPDWALRRHSSQRLLQAKSLLTTGKAFAFPRGLCSRLPAETPPHRSAPQAREHHLSLAGSWGRPPAPARSSLPALGSRRGSPSQPALHGVSSALPGTRPSAGPCFPAPQPPGRATGAHHAAG